MTEPDDTNLSVLIIYFPPTTSEIQSKIVQVRCGQWHLLAVEDIFSGLCHSWALGILIPPSVTVNVEWTKQSGCISVSGLI